MESKKNYYAPMHTAEHILNRTMMNIFNCQRSENCHVEQKKSKCDFILQSEPTQEQINIIEKSVNQIISQNLLISEEFLSYDEAAKLYKLRVDKAENPTIRIVSVGDFDKCPCIGQHVQNTSEIGIFKIISSDFNNNTFRIRFKLINTTENKD